MSILKSPYLKPFKNIYVLTTIVFIIWMVFFDTNSWMIHHELNNDLDALENEKEYYQKEIIKDKKAMKELNTPDGIEKLAREKYYMKKENEDIFLIEYEDSLKQKKSNE